MAQTSSLEGVTDVSLTEELLLLTLEDTGGEFDSVPEIYLNCGIAGAALMDLSLRGKLDSDLSGVFVVDPTSTGDAPLDHVLASIAREPKRLSAGNAASDTFSRQVRPSTSP